MKSSILVSVLMGLALVGCSKSAELDLGTVGDTMAYDKTSLEVRAGAKVTLHFKNNGTSPAMLHSFILVAPGTDNKVAMAGLTAGAAKDFVPDSTDILAKTKLLKPGEGETITFTAPDKTGEYPYICTYPGHYPLMKGILKVTD